MRNIERYDMKILYTDDGKYEAVPYIQAVESDFGKYCLACHVEELQDENFHLRSKYNDWSDYE